MVSDVAGSSPVDRPTFLKTVNNIESILLGIVQGISEFLPISSSFHMRLFENLFNIENKNRLFLLSCHMGTLFSCIIFLRKKIREIILQDRRKLIQIAIALLPLVPCYLILKGIDIKNIKILALFLLLTSLFLFITSININKKTNSSNRKIKDVLFIGLMQGLALIPGISRSGSTIFGASLRGWSIEKSITFSFLLSIPTILGGMILETWRAFKVKPTFDLSYVIGFVTSFFIGLLSIKIIFSIKKRKVFLGFAIYCLITSILVIFLGK